MIGMLRGKVWEIQSERLVIDVNGTGYLLTVPYGLLAKAYPEQELVVYTHVVVREDDLSLYGFSSFEEKQLFLEMLSVSGIGPKAAISLLSTFGAVQIQSAIVSENLNLLTKVPGIGKKTAQRLILELKEKFKGHSSFPTGGDSFSEPSSSHTLSEALQTLLALGFGLDEARLVLGQVLKDSGELTTEVQVKKALRLLAPS
ncbi:Holliday junction branch migration protein RuvA [Desulfosporosinus sp. BICA1-9]|uniref:Holliday junction branch migration protein RuvA n=1 Tax=Desulfosporosinus sp. BICA1-9 TaxID=1531958 RepID=UPI00054B3EBC|nr:Holliday junction branch migration protein RuvA [Desulfosporosinus sp. BICA1-9]KJS48428.1 MAG: ATP-dependent DNA helicase RuvA [Peptococcaceae bacterium BRH_c23]KJS77963.1 MAG: ATP-dependent DNA helicase RuvA [Desulfosporosinus sp. BICA1-9]HBW35068.1 Holliday junction branch migration protein RuvA [Desulfosporosinus sp.]